MSDTSILPRHSTLVEQALEDALRSRADVGDLPNLWNPNTCPARFLPWLAWALSVDDWDDAWPESRKRAVIAASVDVHRRKGTPAGVRAALKAMGYGWAEIVEAKDYPRLGGLPTVSARYPLGRLWRLGDPGMLLGGRPTAGTTRARPLGWGWRLGKPGHWADYMVLLDRVITKDDADALAGRLGKVAPARCRLAQIRLAGVRHALGDGLWQLGRTIPLGGAFGAEGVFTGPEIWVSGLWVPERLFREAESGVLLAFAPLWYLECMDEEHQMVETYGQDYVAYQQYTGMFFPKIGG